MLWHLGKFRTRHELRHRFALITEAETIAGIGGGLDVIGLQPVIGIHVIRMLADDGADHVDRIDAIGARCRFDLAHQLAVIGEQIVDLLVFGIKRCSAGLGAAHGCAGNTRLLLIPVAFRHHTNAVRKGRAGNGHDSRDEKHLKNGAHAVFPVNLSERS